LPQHIAKSFDCKRKQSAVNEAKRKGNAMDLQIRRQVTLGVVIGSRAFFSPAPCQDARRETLAQLERLGVTALILPYEATANGAV
jgi:hypothetical protein